MSVALATSIPSRLGANTIDNNNNNNQSTVARSKKHWRVKCNGQCLPASLARHLQAIVNQYNSSPLFFVGTSLVVALGCADNLQS